MGHAEAVREGDLEWLPHGIVRSIVSVHVLQEFNGFAECCKCLKLKNGSGSELALEESGSIGTVYRLVFII